MDLNLLPVLDALLQEVSVTGAARRLGLSVAATSHALGRIRTALGDPVLVRAGRHMVLTPRGERLRATVRDVVADARRLLAGEAAFEPAALTASFVVLATDQVVTVLGPTIDRLLDAEAPGVSLRFLPGTPDDSQPLREGAADLAICLVGNWSPEIRATRLFTDDFVCLLRRGHPLLEGRLTLERYLAWPHVVVSPLGLTSYVDEALAERGLSRRITVQVPYFMAGLAVAADSDAVLTVSRRMAVAAADRFDLVTVEPPLPLQPYALNLIWHPRHDHDPAHRWLRDLWQRAARIAAPDVHPGARRQPSGAPRSKTES